MKIDGGCHCGDITYEAEIDPEKVGVSRIFNKTGDFIVRAIAIKAFFIGAHS